LKNLDDSDSKLLLERLGTRLEKYDLDTSAVAGVYMVFINVIAEVQTFLNFGCIDGCRCCTELEFHI